MFIDYLCRFGNVCISVQMANLAFNAAQCTDPSYVEAWIGQATIAEMFAHDEAMDLYRHSNELGSHVRRMLVFEVVCVWRGVV